MMQISETLQLQTVTGHPVHAGDITLTQQSQRLTLRLPFGGLVWHRPTAVLVERADRTVRMPIVDVTRIIQLALSSASAFMFSITIKSSMRKEQSS